MNRTPGHQTPLLLQNPRRRGFAWGIRGSSVEGVGVVGIKLCGVAGRSMPLICTGLLTPARYLGSASCSVVRQML